jgi:hypothetical protein
VSVEAGAAATTPGRPSEVTATTTGTTATVTWRPPAGGAAATGYVVSRDGKDSSGNGPATVSVGAGTRSKTFGGLVRGTTYALTVQAVNAAGKGAGARASVTIEQ